jgi:amino acid transporter
VGCAHQRACGSLCNLFIGYLSYFVPWTGAGLWRALVITAAISSLTIINIVGVRATAASINFFTIGKLIPLLLLVGVGMFFVDPQRYSFVTPPPYTSFSQATLLLVFGYVGFETATIPAGEIRDPARHIPFALFVGIGLVVLLYVLVQAVCIGTLPQLASSERPLTDVGLHVLGAPGALIVSAGALLSITGTMNALVFATPRLLFAMAEQRQIPRAFLTTHRRFHTPYVATLFTALVMLGLTLFSTFLSALTLSTIIRLIMYMTTCAALPILRRDSGASRAAFSAPAGSIISVAAILLSVWLVSNSTWDEARLAAIASAFGLLLYVPCALRKDQVRHESGVVPSVGL